MPKEYAIASAQKEKEKTKHGHDQNGTGKLCTKSLEPLKYIWLTEKEDYKKTRPINKALKTGYEKHIVSTGIVQLYFIHHF